MGCTKSKVSSSNCHKGILLIHLKVLILKKASKFTVNTNDTALKSNEMIGDATNKRSMELAKLILIILLTR